MDPLVMGVVGAACAGLILIAAGAWRTWTVYRERKKWHQIQRDQAYDELSRIGLQMLERMYAHGRYDLKAQQLMLQTLRQGQVWRGFLPPKEAYPSQYCIDALREITPANSAELPF